MNISIIFLTEIHATIYQNNYELYLIQYSCSNKKIICMINIREYLTSFVFQSLAPSSLLSFSVLIQSYFSAYVGF